MNILAEQMAGELKKYNEFRIIYHIRPDGDCIGSSYALALALQACGAKCEVCGTYDIPPGHRYLTDNFIKDELSEPVYIAVDCASPERTGSFENAEYTFCIDHHRNNSINAPFKCIEEDCGACAEIVFKIIKALGIEITPLIANLLYLALVMDTMCFRTSDTSPQSFRTAAELAEYGADIYGIGRKHVFRKKPGRVKIEKMLQESFHYTCDGQIITGIITLDDLKKADILDAELEGINSYVEQIDGVKIGITVRELPDGWSRCSTRTSGNIPANLICAAHGGGGHFNAACCNLECSPEKAREIMERTAREFLYKA